MTKTNIAPGSALGPLYGTAAARLRSIADFIRRLAVNYETRSEKYKKETPNSGKRDLN